MGIPWAIEGKRLHNANAEEHSTAAADGDDESSLANHKDVDNDDAYQRAKSMHEF
ncbi:MAG: hypothetical protein SGBAC_012636, partial [Bacillariaceae sp.]